MLIALTTDTARGRPPVPGQTTLAELHAVVQTVFGWGGEHLHRFVICRGINSGVSW